MTILLRSRERLNPSRPGPICWLCDVTPHELWRARRTCLSVVSCRSQQRLVGFVIGEPSLQLRTLTDLTVLGGCDQQSRAPNRNSCAQLEGTGCKGCRPAFSFTYSRTYLQRSQSRSLRERCGDDVSTSENPSCHCVSLVLRKVIVFPHSAWILACCPRK